MSAGPLLSADVVAARALALEAQILGGRLTLEDERLRSEMAKLVKRAPSAKSNNPDLLLYGSMALFQIGGKDWSRWDKAMRKVVVEAQREDGSWGTREAAVLETARMALTLGVYHRYRRVLR